MSQSPLHQSAPAGLHHWLDTVDNANEPSIRVLTLDAVRCVVKRSLKLHALMSWLRRGIFYARAWFLALSCKLFLGEFPRPSVLLRNGLSFETARLLNFYQAGCRVPAVWWHEPDLLVMEYVGDNIADTLRASEAGAYPDLIQAASADMANFHARGFWHGGAQLRNVTLKDGQVWRIDFEENIGEALSLPLAQAYDVYQMLSSLMSMRGMPVHLMPELGQLMLNIYFTANPNPDVRQALQRLARCFAAVAWLFRPVLRLFSSRDIQGFLRVTDILHVLRKR